MKAPPTRGVVRCMAARASCARFTRSALLAVFCGLSLAVPAAAQLSADDIAALAEQGRREGWTFTVAPNPATAYPLEQLCGLIVPPDAEPYEPPADEPPDRLLPTTFSWAAASPPVRNQGGCGSCWAFAALGSMESAIAIHDGWAPDLSEQWLVSCTGAGTCNGGWHTTSFEYLRCAGASDPCGGRGGVRESDFLYAAADIPCGCPYAHPVCLSSWSQVGTNTNAIKQAIYDHGPVATAIYASDAFQAYGGGIFNACMDQVVNHAVVLVGWDDDQGGGVWILRNSWGAGWGEDGYMRIRYGCCRVGYATAYGVYQPTDCNGNGYGDLRDIVLGVAPDCNQNLVPDSCDIAAGIAADCNGNGRIDSCDINQGLSPDCDANGVPDECDLAAGTAADCNANGVPDSCDIAAGSAADCDGNGVPDPCDLAAGAPDCNANAVPDGCELFPAQTFTSPVYTPVGGVTHTFTLVAPPEALGDVTLAFDAVGDLNYANERFDVYVNGAFVGYAFDGVAFDCELSTAALVLAGAAFNAAAATGTVAVTLDPSDGVNAAACGGDYVRVAVRYTATSARTDCNGNGVLDACDIAAGQPDGDGNGVPDVCEAPPVCRGDCNCDGSIGFADIDFFVAGIPNNEAAWAASFPPPGPTCTFANCDVNADGNVGFDDIDPFVARIPSACP